MDTCVSEEHTVSIFRVADNIFKAFFTLASLLTHDFIGSKDLVFFQTILRTFFFRNKSKQSFALL